MVYPHTYRTEHSETHTTNSVYGDYYATAKSRKISIQPELLEILQYIDSNRQQFLDDLAEVIKIKSITTSLKYRSEVLHMIKFVEDWLKKLEMKYECFNIGFYTVDGTKVRLPPVILASIGNDPRKKTICVYLHLDVPKPNRKNWNTDPWTLTDVDKRYYGNGASCGKGQLMMWFHVIQAFRSQKSSLPVNLKLVMESMCHQNSLGLAGFLATRTQDFFANVNNVVVCQSEWIGEKHPCIIYGCVGIIHFQVTIEKNETSATEIKDDMENIFKHVVDEEEHILIKDFHEPVEQITPDEEKIYENIKDFDTDEVRDLLPPYKQSWDKVKLLMSFWRLPSILVDDIQECVCEKKDSSKIKRNFILKIVPRQVVDQVGKVTKEHFKNVVKELKIENTVTCEMVSSVRPWFENFRLPCYNAARRATIQIYKEEPNMIREDRGREAVTILDRILERNILMLPLTCRGSNPGEDNENISNRNYYESTKLVAAYLFQVAKEE